MQKRKISGGTSPQNSRLWGTRPPVPPLSTPMISAFSLPVGDCLNTSPRHTNTHTKCAVFIVSVPIPTYRCLTV